MSEYEYHFWIWMSGPKVWIWIILDCLFLCLNLNIWINKKQSFRYKTNQTTLHSWLLIKNQDQDEEIRIEKKYHWSLGFSDVIRRYSMSERIRPYLDVFRLQIWKKIKKSESDYVWPNQTSDAIQIWKKKTNTAYDILKIDTNGRYENSTHFFMWATPLMCLSLSSFI